MKKRSIFGRLVTLDTSVRAIKRGVCVAKSNKISCAGLVSFSLIRLTFVE